MLSAISLGGAPGSPYANAQAQAQLDMPANLARKLHAFIRSRGVLALISINVADFRADSFDFRFR
jgi:hypothetical protein